MGTTHAAEPSNRRSLKLQNWAEQMEPGAIVGFPCANSASVLQAASQASREREREKKSTVSEYFSTKFKIGFGKTATEFRKMKAS